MIVDHRLLCVMLYDILLYYRSPAPRTRMRFPTLASRPRLTILELLEYGKSYRIVWCIMLYESIV